jgi:hypothetical protein
VLRTNQNINSGAGTSIALRGGGLNANNSSGTVTIAPAVNFQNSLGATAEGVIYNRSGGTLLLSGIVTANGLTKFGPGTLNLSANNGTALAGGISINQGTVQLFGPTATGTYNVAGTSSVVLAGGQLNLRSNNSALPSGTVITTTMQMGLTVAAGIPTATLDVNRSGADSNSSGTFTFNPATVAAPGLVLAGSPGPQGQTLTVSGGNYNVTFGANALNTFTGNVTINTINTRTLTLGAVPSIFGTTPIITKSGDGTLIVGPNGVPAGFPAQVVSPGAQVVLNAGTLELRSVLSFGTGGAGGTSLVLNGGTLNLRRDSAGSYGGLGSSTAFNVTVNGNTTISTDRVATTVSNYAIRLGSVTVNGNPTVNFTGANGVYGVFLSAGHWCQHGFAWPAISEFDHGAGNDRGRAEPERCGARRRLCQRRDGAHALARRRQHLRWRDLGKPRHPACARVRSSWKRAGHRESRGDHRLQQLR